MLVFLSLGTFLRLFDESSFDPLHEFLSLKILKEVDSFAEFRFSWLSYTFSEADVNSIKNWSLLA